MKIVRGPLGNALSVFEDLVIAHHAHHPDQVHRVDVVYGLTLRVIAPDGMVSAQRQNVGNAENGGAQDISLQTQAVAIAAGELHNRLQAGLLAA